MKHKRLEDLSAESREAIAAARADALAEAQAITSIPDEQDLTDEQLSELEELGEVIDGYESRLTELDVEDAARADRVAAARGKITKSAAADEAPADATDEEPDETEEVDEETEDEAEAEIEEKELVTASAGAPKRGAVRTARKASPPVETDKPESKVVGKLVAAANITGIEGGSELDMDGLVKAFINKSRAFSGRKTPAGSPAVFDRYGVVTIERPKTEFTIDGRTTVGEQMAIIDAVSKEARLNKGGKTGLVAAGGWCAPSETLYDFCELEEVDGLLSLPEVTITHGGLNFTKGPDLAGLLADPAFGFTLTEAQLEAGAPEKVCFVIDCPDFEDHRLDAVGWCFQAPIPTASPAGWPELIRRYLNLAVTAHRYRMNADSLTRLSTAIGAAANYVELGSATADILDALSLQATALRESLFLKTNATIEVILPLWAPDAIRADLARRSGDLAYLLISDAQIRSMFAVRNLAPQFVRGYQPLNANGLAFATTLQAMLYPAGSYVLGVNDVISLDTVYDSESLKQNMYTSAFFEEARMLFNPCGTGRKVEISLTGNSQLLGIVGASKLGETVAP